MHVTTAASMRTLVFTHFISTLSHSWPHFRIWAFNTLHTFLQWSAQLTCSNTTGQHNYTFLAAAEQNPKATWNGYSGRSVFHTHYGSSLPFSSHKEFRCSLELVFPPTRQKHSVTLSLWNLETSQRKAHMQDFLFAIHYSIDNFSIVSKP